ncbi:MAG: NAD(P)H-dependent oxidoreductase, partial [Aquabacterium sp.]|uniref:NADPH-dependent FMN reductase n=1 Tax=Aquabacterium sp. TaxID=1872578 RepID=UPI003BB107FE
MTPTLADLPNVVPALFDQPDVQPLAGIGRATHPPRILLLYGSLRERSYSKLLTLEAARLLNALGADTRIYDPAGLPLPDGAPDTHPKVQELRDLAYSGLNLPSSPVQTRQPFRFKAANHSVLAEAT